MTTLSIEHEDRLIWVFTALAGKISATFGDDLDTRLKAIIDEKLAEPQTVAEIGRWEIDWGPVVLQLTDYGQDINAYYGVRSVDDPSKVVLAISGTNPASAFDWLVEDGFVFQQVSWPGALGSDPDAKLALGTALGLNLLLQGKPKAEVVKPNVGMMAWLRGLTDQGPVKVSVCGHSLGGALSPALGLWLMDTQGSPNQWDPAGTSEVAVYPFAGPTPGNPAFSSYYDTKLGGVTRRWWNHYDIVPNAWAQSQLQSIPELYVPDIGRDPVIEGLADAARALAHQGGDYEHVRGDIAPFPAQVAADKINPIFPDSVNFFVQLVYQHTKAYDHTFEFPTPAVAPTPPKPGLLSRAWSWFKSLFSFGAGTAELPEALEETVKVIDEAAKIGDAIAGGIPETISSGFAKRLSEMGIELPDGIEVAEGMRTKLALGDQEIDWPSALEDWAGVAAALEERLGARCEHCDP